MADFVLDARLAADTAAVMEAPLCAVRLMNDRSHPWLVLVPRRAGLRELHDLSAEDGTQLMAELAAASRGLERLYSPDKINVGALGNLVAQLHVHVVARFASDPAWPGPVWGARPPEPYPPGDLDDRVRDLHDALHQLL